MTGSAAIFFSVAFSLIPAVVLYFLIRLCWNDHRVHRVTGHGWFNRAVTPNHSQNRSTQTGDDDTAASLDRLKLISNCLHVHFYNKANAALEITHDSTVVASESRKDVNTGRSRSQGTALVDFFKRFTTTNPTKESVTVDTVGLEEAKKSDTIPLKTHECPICIEEYKDGESVAWPKIERCHHTFHHNCISLWLMHHDQCPLCRVDLLGTEEANIDTGMISTSITASSRLIRLLSMQEREISNVEESVHVSSGAVTEGVSHATEV